MKQDTNYPNPENARTESVNRTQRVGILIDSSDQIQKSMCKEGMYSEVICRNITEGGIRFRGVSSAVDK